MFDGWFEATAATDCPGARAHCRCLLLLRFVTGTDALGTDEHGSWVGFGHTRWRLRWCPSCGGQVGVFRPELVAAWSRFLAARERHGPALELRDREAVAAYCAANGFGALEGEGYSAAGRSAEDCAQLGCAWDPDHERWYPWLAFAPPDDLARDPFVPGSLDG